MTLAQLQGELLKAKEGMGKAKIANASFEKVLQEMSILKSRSIANSQTRDQILNEMKNKEIIDLFSSIETDFEELRTKMAKQSIEKEKIVDFFESVRTKKSFGFIDMEGTINFIEKTAEALEASHVAVRPEFIGMVDLGPLAIEMGLMKNNTGVIVEVERFSEFIVALLSKKCFHDLVFETDKAKISLHGSKEVVIESDNVNIRIITRMAKPEIL
ncbi:MAG: hypothetical protein NTY48_04455 [Candidatus Diapherotrites archaeon]|nr:hypothetical protein [Candidatus Diapherotrites archaeon]